MDSSEKVEPFFGLSARRRLFYKGRLLTMVGDYATTEAAHRQARVHYPPQVAGDPTIMDIDRATALINSNDPEAGASVIVSTLSGLPADHQGGIFLALAGRAFDAVPTRVRRLPAPRTCAELLDTLSASQ